jgi:hypothetical protein
MMVHHWLLVEGRPIAAAHEENGLWYVTEVRNDDRKPFTVTAPTKELAEHAFMAVWG